MSRTFLTRSLTGVRRIAALALVVLPALAVLGAAARAEEAGAGRRVVVDGHPVELVVSEREIAFLLGDHDGTPLSTEGVRAKAYVSLDGTTRTLALSPAPPNRLTAPLPAPLEPGAKVVLSARLHGHALQVRFQP